MFNDVYSEKIDFKLDLSIDRRTNGEGYGHGNDNGEGHGFINGDGIGMGFGELDGRANGLYG